MVLWLFLFVVAICLCFVACVLLSFFCLFLYHTKRQFSNCLFKVVRIWESCWNLVVALADTWLGFVAN